MIIFYIIMCTFIWISLSFTSAMMMKNVYDSDLDTEIILLLCFILTPLMFLYCIVKLPFYIVMDVFDL